MSLPLGSLQESFKNALVGDDLQCVLPYIVKKGLDGEQRLQIYQNNFFEIMHETLKSIFPTVQRLVGDDFFAAASQSYIRQYPSMSGDLAQLGKQFPGFLADFIPARGLIYLPEVAALDWAYHEVFHAADHPPFAIEKLQALQPEYYGKIKFIVHPASRILACQFPLLKIWQICQDEATSEYVALDAGGDDILVIRRELTVRFEKLTKGEAALLIALSNGAIFEEACALALNAEPAYQVDFHLQHCLFSGIIIDFIL